MISQSRFFNNIQNSFEFRYVRRWGLILVIAFYVGATAAVWYNIASPPKRFEATAQLNSPGQHLTIISSPASSPKRALELIVETAVLLEARTGQPVSIDESLSVRPAREFRWKNVFFVGIVGILAAIGAVYIFEQISEEFQRAGNPGRDIFAL